MALIQPTAIPAISPLLSPPPEELFSSFVASPVGDEDVRVGGGVMEEPSVFFFVVGDEDGEPPGTKKSLTC